MARWLANRSSKLLRSPNVWWSDDELKNTRTYFCKHTRRVREPSIAFDKTRHFTSFAKCFLASVGLLCEQHNSFLSIYHSQFAYTILCGALGCYRVGPTAFSFLVSQTLWREEGKKRTSGLCTALFASVCFCCLLARCMTARQIVRLPLQRPNDADLLSARIIPARVYILCI